MKGRGIAGDGRWRTLRALLVALVVLVLVVPANRASGQPIPPPATQPRPLALTGTVSFVGWAALALAGGAAVVKPGDKPFGQNNDFVVTASAARFTVNLDTGEVTGTSEYAYDSSSHGYSFATICKYTVRSSLAYSGNLGFTPDQNFGAKPDPSRPFKITDPTNKDKYLPEQNRYPGRFVGTYQQTYSLTITGGGTEEEGCKPIPQWTDSFTWGGRFVDAPLDPEYLKTGKPFLSVYHADSTYDLIARVYAQAAGAAVNGRVTELDNDGNVKGVSGVKIEASSGVTTTTDTNGSYDLSLSAGTYTLTPSREGYVFVPVTATVTLATQPAKQDFFAQRLVGLRAIEVTQGIQNWLNAVPLYANRPTFVRTHFQIVHDPGATRWVPNVKARLVGRRGGNVLGSLAPLSPTTGLTVGQNPDRAGSWDSFLFQLPPTWITEGAIELEVVGDGGPPIECPDRFSIAHKCQAAVTFGAPVIAKVRLHHLVYLSDFSDTEIPVSVAEQAQALQELRSVLPLSELQVEDAGEFVTGGFTLRQPDGAIEFLRLINGLKRIKIADGCLATCHSFYVGLLGGSPPFVGTTGLTSAFWDIFAGYINEPNTLAHEFGHAARRQHVECSGTEVVPPFTSYPYPNGQISKDQTGNGAFFGFNPATRSVIRPTAGDLMSYCATTWPSDYTWTGIADRLIARGAPAAPVTVQAEQASVIVSGIITPTAGTGTVDSLLALRSSPSAPATTGAYQVRFENTAGQELAVYPFDPEPLTDGPAGFDTGPAAFTLLLPWDPRTARVALLGPGQQPAAVGAGPVTRAAGPELAARRASATPPTITVQAPVAGALLAGASAPISWTATDPDRDPLQFMVQYSRDGGGHWQTLVTDWLSTTYTVDLARLAGSSQGVIRVLASDGFHTTAAQSATFSVAKHAPLPVIHSPLTNTRYIADQLVILEGDATDAEDGRLSGSVLTWTSDRNGALGSGRALAVDALKLTEGRHSITLTARDADGQTGTASIAVEIRRTRPSLPPELATSSGGLAFVARDTGRSVTEQWIGVRNAGDGALNWTASASQPWIRLSATSGVAPAELAVSVDAAGLARGHYTGTVTIAATGGVTGTSRLDVELQVLPPLQLHLPALLVNSS